MRKHVKGNVSWVGYIDWELESFHGDDYSIMNGSSQNAYLIEEEKTVLIDTVWTPHRFDFVENLKKEIDLKKIDFIVANHGECDHSGSLTALMEEIPDTPIYCTANAVKSIEGQYGKRGWNFKVVKTGDSVGIGKGKTAEGLNYSINQEKYLKIFLSDPYVPIDNSASERAIRTFCVGKKTGFLSIRYEEHRQVQPFTVFQKQQS